MEKKAGRVRGKGEYMRIGVLTGGGDCPGLNAVIRAIVRLCHQGGDEAVGIRNGWTGLVQNLPTISLDLNSVSGIIHRGGTILGTSRTNPYKTKATIRDLRSHFYGLGLDALVVIGGEDTLGVAARLAREKHPIVAVPKTIDNDLSNTDYTFGFDTACNTVMEAIDRLHTTAESHHRIMVVEVMGRHAGWIALYAGIAGGADVILIPEIPVSISEVVKVLKMRQARGKYFSIVVVAEGAKLKGHARIMKTERRDEFGHKLFGGVAQLVEAEIARCTGFETRMTQLGHIQRGGSPTAFDRMLGTRFGVKAVELIRERKFGYMASLKGTEIVEVPISSAVGRLKLVDRKLYQMATNFFG